MNLLHTRFRDMSVLRNAYTIAIHYKIGG